MSVRAWPWPVAAAVLTLAASLGAITWAIDHDTREAEAAASIDYPAGQPMAERCALARARVRVPFPERWLRCTDVVPQGQAEAGDFWRGAPAGAVGQCVCDPGRVWWIVVYAGPDRAPVPTQSVADTIAHEVGHAYSFLAWDQPDEAWVAHHEPFADHWQRCVTTTWAPC